MKDFMNKSLRKKRKLKKEDRRSSANGAGEARFLEVSEGMKQEDCRALETREE